MANEIAAAVVDAWDEIERWYEAQGAAHLILPPASGEQIAALEATLGVELPEAVTASLRRHNGSTDGGWPTGTLLSCDGILQEVSVWRDLLTSGDFDDLKDFVADGEALKAGFGGRSVGSRSMQTAGETARCWTCHRGLVEGSARSSTWTTKQGRAGP